MSTQHPHLKDIPRYLVVGLLTVAPFWVTWLVFEFIFSQLSQVGTPWVVALSRAVRPASPSLAEALIDPLFQSSLGVLITLLALYLLGWTATRVVGRRLIHGFEMLVQRIPLVQTIYGGTRKFLAAVQTKPQGVQQVVLISFPCPGMKAVAFVTRIMRDETTGQKLAAVYVPTSPNPTSGYMEIVPLEDVIPTEWTLDEAMSFVITGGTNAPEAVHYHADPQLRPHAMKGGNVETPSGS